MEKEYLKEALQALRRLRENGPLYTDIGICANADTDVDGIVLEFSSCWEKYSGDILYPVPAVKYFTPFQEFNQTKNLWDRETEYGQLRWELLDHLIDCVEREL